MIIMISMKSTETPKRRRRSQQRFGNPKEGARRDSDGETDIGKQTETDKPDPF